MPEQEVKNAIRNIPDFPQKGIQFKDLTTVFVRPDCLTWLKQQMVNKYQGKGVTKVIGIESRGLIIAPMVAEAIGAGFVPIRKPGKLPRETISCKYDLEYGSNELFMHKDSVEKGQRVLIVDDLLATGGTAKAAATMIEELGGIVAGYAFVIELEGLPGRKMLEDYDVRALMVLPDK